MIAKTLAYVYHGACWEICPTLREKYIVFFYSRFSCAKNVRKKFHLRLNIFNYTNIEKDFIIAVNHWEKGSNSNAFWLILRGCGAVI